MNLNDKSLRILNQEILIGLKKIRELKSEVVGFSRAKQRAQKEHLSTEEHKFICDYENKLGQRDNLERLLKKLMSPNAKQNENLQAFQTNNLQYWTIQAKLQRPYIKKFRAGYTSPFEK